MKKPFLIFASVILATLSYGAVVSLWAESSVVAASSTVKLYMSPASAGLTTGYTTSLQLRLYINTSAKIDYADARVSFSTANLEVVSISKQGSYFNYGSGPSVTYNNSNGLLSVTGSGPVLSSPADVVLATVTVKGKAAGIGAMSYTADSQIGDITSGGHVKDALSSRVGASINVSNPPVSPPPAGSTGAGSSSPTAPTASTPGTSTSTSPTATDNSQPAPATSPATGNTQDSSTNPPSTDVGSAIQNTVTAPPVWLKFLLPATALIGVIGAGTLGYVLYAKRRQKEVTLPDDLGINEVMPSTEQAADEMPDTSLIPDEFSGVETATTELASQELSEPVPDLFAETAEHPEEPVHPSLDSVLAQPPELLPEEMRTVPDRLDEVPMPPEEPLNEVQSPVLGSPQPLAPPMPLPANLTANEPVIVPEMPTAAPVAAATPTIVEPASPTPSAMPTPNQPEIIPVTPAIEPAMPVVTPPPQAVEMPPQVQPPVTPAPTATTIDSTDYKNMPDMYDLAEQRFKTTASSTAQVPPAKPQTV